MRRKLAKLSNLERRKLALLRIEATRREDFDKDLASNRWKKANISAKGAMLRRTHHPIGIGKKSQVIS